MQYKFDWDQRKASTNIQKHKVSFQQAASVFRDPHHLSFYDDEHSEDEDRWITLGIGDDEALLIVVHTFEQIDKNNFSIRIISSRKATPCEITQYKEVNR